MSDIFIIAIECVETKQIICICLSRFPWKAKHNTSCTPIKFQHEMLESITFHKKSSVLYINSPKKRCMSLITQRQT